MQGDARQYPDQIISSLWVNVGNRCMDNKYLLKYMSFYVDIHLSLKWAKYCCHKTRKLKMIRKLGGHLSVNSTISTFCTMILNNIQSTTNLLQKHDP